MSYGVYFNIPFRQIAGTLAAYCHIKSAILYSKRENRLLRNALITSALLGAAFVAALVLAR